MNHNTTEIKQISPELIAGYVLMRSLSSKNLYNVFVVDSDGSILFAAATDLTFEKAQAMVEVINNEYYPYVPTPTEAIEVDLAGQKRYFNAVK